ncbi:MAG: TraR/DksA family transcriptional regulator [Actinomycetota bacterium]|jgi:DnaK suppressor protein
MPTATPFAPSTLTELAGRLEQRRCASARLAAALRDDAARAIEDLDVSDLLDNDNPDGGNNGVARASALALARLAARTAGAADEALVRLAAGTYGACDGCGQRIPLARLRAMPETRLCVACKTSHDRSLALAG